MRCIRKLIKLPEMKTFIKAALNCYAQQTENFIDLFFNGKI